MRKLNLMLLSILSFTLLFYRQDSFAGFDLAILIFLIWGILFYYLRHKKGLKTYDSKGKLQRWDGLRLNNNPGFWWWTAGCIISAVSCAWYGDLYAFGAAFISLTGLAYYAFHPKIKPLFYPLIWIQSWFSFPIRLFFTHWIPKDIKQGNIGKRVLTFVLIPVLITSVFTLVYAQASEIFSHFLGNLFRDFDLFNILILLVLGFFLFFNLWYPFIFSDLIGLNTTIKTDFSADRIRKYNTSASSKKTDFLRQTGTASMLLINVLLFIFILTYNYEQFFRPTQLSRLSMETHQRVGTIIFSIALAILLILYLFGSRLNFDKQNKSLKKLTYLWISLNLILILSTFLKTASYIQVFGLTFKRAGVCIFLSFSVLGLAITYLKVKHQKTNYYLFKNMLRYGIAAFIFGSMVNMSWIVTQYNLITQSKPDFDYLRSLDYNKGLLYKTYGTDPNWELYFDGLESSPEAYNLTPFLSLDGYTIYLHHLAKRVEN